MDLKIETADSKFKFRVAGILIKNNKVLTVSICHNGFYCFPGGHVHLGESSQDAVKREMNEEVGVVCENVNLFAVVENFFNSNGKKYHELSYFYIVEAKNGITTTDFSIVENDEGVMKDLEFKWVDLDKLYQIDLRPSILLDKLSNKDYAFKHFIFKQDKG